MKTCRAPVFSAATLAEALDLRVRHPDATVLAGGTDLMVYLETEAVDPVEVIDIWNCRDLRGTTVVEGGWRIGALSTWTDVALDRRLPAVLRECARTIGAAQIQNRGTVGGNIVNASPAGDSLPVWLAMDAVFEVASARGARQVAAVDFFLGYRKVDLAPDELLVAVFLPDPGDDLLYYRKVGTRFAQAISKVVLAGRLRLRDGAVAEARVAMGSVAPVPLRCRSVEAALLGRPVDPATADEVNQDIAPIDDVRSTAEYRKAVAVNIVRGWLESVASQLPVPSG